MAEKLILKYLHGELTETEQKELLEWLEEPKNKEIFKSYTKLQHNLSYTLDPSCSSKAFKNVKQEISANQQTYNFRRYLKYAAVFVVLLGGIVFSYFTFFQPTKTSVKENWVQLELKDGSVKYIEPNQETFNNTENHVKGSSQNLVYSPAKDTPAKEIAYNTLRVPYGKTFEVELADGTKVNLNSGSSLRYPTVFPKDSVNRKVYLNGEAFFDVSHNPDKPFVVAAKNMHISVLGTQFNFTNYKEDARAYAVLVSGKIMAANPVNKQEIAVKPGYKVFYDQDNLTTEKVYVKKYTSWLDNQLMLIGDSFAVIKNKLERRYDVEIVNNYTALNNIVITATFKDEDILKVLETFRAYKDFDYTYENNRIIISEPK